MHEPFATVARTGKRLSRLGRLGWIGRIALILLPLLIPPGAHGGVPPSEELLVFIQPGNSEVEATFQKNVLPEIRTMAEQMGVAVSVIDARKGAPPEVGITPLIVYQNHFGRSIYQGRYTDLQRISQFIRTSRVVPQTDVPLDKTELAIHRVGRSRIWAPIKITPVSGTIPDGHDPARFLRDATSAVASGLTAFSIVPRTQLRRTDRGFYMDFYPWRSPDGTLYLSTALFSQFHCKEPVFDTKKSPLTGAWRDRDALFEKAAAEMEKQILFQLSRTDTGDGFDPVSAQTPQATWQQLGHPLPPPPRVTGQPPPRHPELPNHWIFTSSPDEPVPAVQFRFMAPLDYYRGEATRVRGELFTGPEGDLTAVRGAVEVVTPSITMGQEALDHTIQGSLFLHAKAHPKADFHITSCNADVPKLRFGSLARMMVSGLFQLKGRTVSLSLPLELEPIFDRAGRLRLSVSGRFKIDLDAFGIENADGPSPANKTVIVDLNMAFQPASPPATKG